MTVSRPRFVRKPVWWLCVIGIAAIACAVLVAAARSQGYYWADDYIHLLWSKSVPSDPRVILDMWGRPIMTLTYLPAALIGDGAVRLTSLLLLFSTAAICWRIARERNLPLAPGAALLFLGQPLTSTLGFAALPATVFSLLLAIALWLRVTNRDVAAAVVVSLLPLARLEGILVAVIWGVFLLQEKRSRLVPLLGVGMGAWGLVAANIFGDPLWLLHSNPYSFLTANPYSSVGWVTCAGIPLRPAAVVGGDPCYLLYIWAPSFGQVVGGLAIAAAFYPREIDRLSAVLVIAFSAFFTAIWGLPLLFGSIGTGVYLVDISVPIALLAHQTLVSSWEPKPAWIPGVIFAVIVSAVIDLRWPGPDNLIQLAIVAMLVAIVWIPHEIGRGVRAVSASVLVLLTAIVSVIQVRPLALTGQPLLARQLANSLVSSHQRIDITSDPFFAWYAWQQDPRLGNRFLSGSTLRSAIESAPSGARVVWDLAMAAPYASTDDMRRWDYSEDLHEGDFIVWVRSSPARK